MKAKAEFEETAREFLLNILEWDEGWQKDAEYLSQIQKLAELLESEHRRGWFAHRDDY